MMPIIFRMYFEETAIKIVYRSGKYPFFVYYHPPYNIVSNFSVSQLRFTMESLNSTEGMARAQFDRLYSDLLNNLLNMNLLIQSPSQSLRQTTPQEYIETICKTQEQQDCLLQEKVSYLKCIPFPTHQGGNLMIKPNRIYVISPSVRKQIFESLKHLFVLALHGPELTGVAQVVQQNAINQQQKQYAAYHQQQQKSSPIDNTNTSESSPPNSFEEIMSGILPADISKDLTSEITELFTSDSQISGSMPNLSNPADLFQFAQNLMHNPKIQAICENVNSKMQEQGQTFNEAGLEKMTNMGEQALKNMPVGEAAAFAPILKNLFAGKAGGGNMPSNMDPNEPGFMEIIMRTLKEQSEKGKSDNLGATFSIVARDLTAPKQGIDDDDIANMTPEQFEKLQSIMQMQGYAPDLENDLEMD